MKIIPTEIPGCFEIHPDVHVDERGTFVKTFHEPTFKALGLETHFSEEYYSISRQRVLRGLHFQRPPHHHAKLVYCTDGEVLDAVVDLRKTSPTFGRHATLRLEAKRCNMLYVPPGLAHGFYVPVASASMVYRVTTVYAAQYDTGIHWNSAGIAWPDERPIVSARDSAFLALSDFDSPFDGAFFGE